MRDIFRSITIVVFTLIGATSAAFAQEDAGWFRAEINGETMEWRIDPQQSDWFGDLDQVQSFTSILSKRMYEGVLPSWIGLSLYRTEENWFVESIDIGLIQETLGFYSSSDGGDVKVEVFEASMDGDIMVIKGVFSAAMFYHIDYSGKPDMSNLLAIKDGPFEVRLPLRN